MSRHYIIRKASQRRNSQAIQKWLNSFNLKEHLVVDVRSAGEAQSASPTGSYDYREPICCGSTGEEHR